ncbi:hypothetical protein A2866_05130 [Candidatus Roizmanbacteria bacterium RIFCSPHIGHO2_01_FULL_39_8]|uniref:Peptidoglycan hydrolase PcsB coiled-coil domain-containing protein n=3 Tax=Candidatus Roizmaniibacteriota TaxID=1752723 RepID=A0A1F7GH12_9BACT|nr:MAG: hypothetical protein A2866_05130 [Candidatus Roizmanbacteria bacterium RIFCSPHIGHO2_01_FULL_39_8]OGK28470.1 MAG: hypothetical protein A3C28_04115 [Candidatus Roizmanbacteria bacterium RIFCSPHIGHO2_02_FULL_39_9]OGK36584.1 MAG: hypothetical protein A3F60_01000 [Candidatus Roizmanbacteria bacterium RIFCSPHIGHO2_12_FULL_39_8]
MTKKIAFIFFAFFLIFFHPYFKSNSVSAIECTLESIQNNRGQAAKLDEISKECEKQATESQNKINTLSSQIQYMNSQINLTTLKIQETETKIESTQKEIEIITTRIGGLDNALDYLSNLLLNKVVAGYKNKSISVFDMLLNSQSANDLISRMKYMKTAQQNNQKLLVQVQETKLNFEEQKNLREEKKIELDKLELQLNAQKDELDNQKVAKQKILADTQNDERIYQRLLEQAKAEFAAIQGIVAGAGTETKIRDVKKGDTIASLISGSSCNSSGTHLHFIVQEGDSVINPFQKLKSVDYINDSGGDTWNPSGDWDWPLSPTIEFHQGYGLTWFVQTYRWYPSHNGIDISGSSNSVVAVADGELYRGSYSLGCTLPYVKLIHKDSNITTLYLHVYSS